VNPGLILSSTFVYQQAKQSLEKKYDMTMLKPMKYNNTYALAVKKSSLVNSPNTVPVNSKYPSMSSDFNALNRNDVLPIPSLTLEFTGTVLGELTKEDLKSKKEDAVYQQAKQSLETSFLDFKSSLVNSPNTVPVNSKYPSMSSDFNALNRNEKSDDIDGYLEFTGTVLGELTKEDLKSKKEDAV
jgi:glycine betaine/choline ABC-type transport system substrate-binding protein